MAKTLDYSGILFELAQEASSPVPPPLPDGLSPAAARPYAQRADRALALAGLMKSATWALCANAVFFRVMAARNPEELRFELIKFGGLITAWVKQLDDRRDAEQEG